MYVTFSQVRFQHLRVVNNSRVAQHIDLCSAQYKCEMKCVQFAVFLREGIAHENSMFLISGIVGEVIGILLKETAIPGKACVVNRRDGIANLLMEVPR